MAFPSTASTWQLQNAKSFRKQTDPCMDQDSCLNLPVALPRWCLCSHLPQLEFEKAKLRLSRVEFLTPKWSNCFMIGHIRYGPRGDGGLTSDPPHVPFLYIDNVDEILVSRGFLNWTGHHVPVFPVHSTHSFTNRKACQPISMRVLGWCHPWDTWLMGDIRPELNSMVTIGHHFSHITLTCPMSL